VLASALQELRRLLGGEDDAASETPTPQPQAVADPRLVAIDKLRGIARWLILAFAAIGAALAGTAPLSNVGKLAIGDWRLWVAAVAAAAGLGGIAFAMWSTANVLAPVSLGLTDLVVLPAVQRIFNEHFELLDGHGTDLATFKTRYDAARERYLNAVSRARDVLPADADAAAELEAARDDFYEYAPIVKRITNEGLLATVRARFRKAQRLMFFGAFVAALAIVAFAWAANPPKAAPSKHQRVLALQPIEPSPYGSGVAIGPQGATQALKSNGVSAATATAFIQAFSGRLVIQTVRPGFRFVRYSPTKSSQGRFLTLARFANPQGAIRGLHLPWANSAVCRETVVVRRPTLVLVGGIAGGRPGLKQFLILDPHAFSFGKGGSYSRVACR
jgi:hypothetical protein